MGLISFATAVVGAGFFASDPLGLGAATFFTGPGVSGASLDARAFSTEVGADFLDFLDFLVASKDLVGVAGAYFT